LIFGGLDRLAGESGFPVLYFHPYELATASLHIALPEPTPAQRRIAVAWYGVRYNLGRSRVSTLLAEAAGRFRLVTCEEALPDVERVHGASSRAVPDEGSGVRSPV
jgi:hypothetical protein